MKKRKGLKTLKESAEEFFSGPVTVIRWFRLALLLLFVLTMPLVIYLGNTEYGYTKTIYTFLYISALTLCWLLELFLNEEKEISYTGLLLPAGLLFVSGLLSLVNASSKGVVLQSLALLVFFYLIYLIIVNTIQTRKEASYLLISLATSGFGATIYGILQYFGLVRGALGFVASPTNIISFMGNQNYLGGFISYLFIPVFALILTIDSGSIRAFLTLCLGLFFFILFPIGARGAWLSLVIASIAFVSLLLYYRPLKDLRGLKIALFSLLIVLLIAYLFASAPGPLNSLLGYSAPETGGNQRGILSSIFRPLNRELVIEGGARLEDWYVGWEMLKDHPLFGIGLGNYKIKFLEYRSRLLSTPRGEGFGKYIPRAAQAHNEYVQFAAEMGLVGIVSLMIALVSLGVNAFHRTTMPEDPSARILGTGLIGGIFGFLVHSAVSFPAHLPASSLVFAAFLGLLNSGAFGKPDHNFKLTGFTRYLVFSLVPVLVISVSVIAYRDWRANVLMGQGKNQLEYGNYYIAEEKLEKSLRLDFQPRQTYYYLGVVESKLGNDGSALRYFKKAEGQFEPYNLFFQLGIIHLQRKELDRAEKYFEKCLSLGGKETMEVQSNYFLARIAVRRGKLDEASDILERILAKDSNFEQAITLQGDIAQLKGKTELAKEKWRQALGLIREKLARVNQRLSGEINLTERGELEEMKERLTNELKKVEKKLGK